MVALGIGIGAVQFIPLFELASTNWRSGSASYAQVIDWAHKPRDVVQFVMPNFYGNPSHHSYFDVFSGQVVSQFTRADGTPTFPTNTIDWGIKNYVEGALYVGILPLALSVYALVHGWILRRDYQRRELLYLVTFALLALLSLTFMFGLPTYALLYYGFPGINQLHSPFRWIFALTLSVAVLAGYGADALARSRNPLPTSPVSGGVVNAALPGQWAKRIGWILISVGVAILAALLLSRVFYAQIEPLIERIFSSMAKANEAFSDARMFYSYQFRNALFFGLFMLAAGIVMRVSRCPIYSPIPLFSPDPGNDPPKGGRTPIWEPLAVLVIALDLMVASWGFNPASDPLLLDFTPPAIAWLQAQPGDWRYTTLDDPAQSPIMQANVGWRYGLDDIRGYESIIPGQYVEYMRQLAPQYQLDFNRIAPLRTTDTNDINGQQLVGALYDWGLRLLNVRYVVTHKSTDIGDWFWSLVYEDDAVRIWENKTYFPRAYTYPFSISNVGFGADAWYEGRGVAAIVSDTGREKFVDVSTEFSTWLVVSENYFPGWRAFIRPQGSGEEAEQPLEVQLVLSNFQGVHLPEVGNWTVRLVYSPASFQLGAFGTFMSLVLVVLLLGVWLWRLVVVRDEASGVTVVARNSLAPIILNLFNRGIDFAFAFVMLRILGPEGAGVYYYAVIVFGWFDIFTNFGLNTFLTREVSRDRSHAGRYLYNTSLLRVLLALVGVALLLAFIGARQSVVSPPLSSEALLAIGLLYVGLLPNSLSTGLSALFYAFEKAEVPAAIATVATISKAMFGVLALLLGYGVVGLAAVSIVTNLITLAIMAYMGRGMIGAFERRPEPPLMHSMVRQSWPLLLNHFLQTIFLQIDVIIIEAFHGERMVGQYSVAYKWLLALNVIPSFFTMALLPVMSRQAREDRAALKRTYALGIKLLVATALPIAVLFTFLAESLTWILGGAQYLPDGAIATQIIIWSIPIGWMNSLTQYVLIALDLQRRITGAFIVAVSFNIIANLIFVPQYGYRAAALITIASEAILLVPFGLLLQRALGSIPWLELVWRPLVATGMMLALMVTGWAAHPVIGLVLGLVTYPAVLLALRPFNEDEMARLRPLLPGRFKRLASPV
jgi:O-antigen/teichoic acid export membrane protein